MKNVVITGADGFIGSHLVKEFVNCHYQVTAIVIKNSPTRNRIEGIPGVEIVEGDLTEWEMLVDKIPKFPVAFFHLAWVGVSPESRELVQTQLTNIDLCLNAVRLAHRIGAERFVLPGSTTEYMNSGQIINEQACPSPQNAYGSVKIATRFLCASLCEELKVPYIYVVITGIYSADRVDNNVIYYAISNLLERKRPVFTKLEQLWDYVHIDDVVLALKLIAEKGKENSFYVIGHGDNWPLARYIYQIRDAIDPELPLGIGEIPYKNNKMPSSCVDLTSLHRDTGFLPAIPFEEGILGVITKIAEMKNS